MWRPSSSSLALLVFFRCGEHAVESFAFLAGGDTKSRFGMARKGSSSTARRTISSTSLEFTTANEALCGLDIPSGLKETLLSNARESFAKRIWIVDNSGSMKMWDGHLVLNQDTASCCTRWDELKETVACHAQLSAALGAPTDFLMLNPSPGRRQGSFRVGYGSRMQRDSKRARAIMAKSRPSGMTPLHTRIHQVKRQVTQMLPQLNRDGSKVALIICTDGCNFDAHSANACFDQAEMNREFLKALESLQGLPVWVVIRLCTDFGPVVDFYNSLDERLDWKLDVLDDHVAEALEVNRHNKWLNYALVLHRMREMGQREPLFDLLDERPFTKEEIREFCGFIFGPDKLPPECTDWAAFCNQVDKVQRAERMHWNPRTKELSPWIDIHELELVDCIDLDEYIEESV